METPSIERVRVAVRVRPRNAREEALDYTQHTVDVDATTNQICVSKKKPDGSTDRDVRSSYDCVFPPTATQRDVFDYVRDAVTQVAQGFNCTIFAYGQTGTGKTHTMLGKQTEDANPQDGWGVIPRAVESLFAELASLAHHGGAGAIVHCSYMQIYNNEVFDLLQESKSRMKEPLAVREMIKGNDKHMYVSGLSEFRVTSVDETLALVRLGNKNRSIRATEYNEKSSRSHALLQLAAEVESRGAEGPTTIIRRAKLSLVDLAGSEKWDTDVAMGNERCKELTSINQSLSALGNVISALANPKRAHVPYRDSKLTRLLLDSLGGNTRTTVLATISQDASAIDETISTLQFADRAKRVTLRVQANELVDDAILLAQARREIARLKLLVKKNATHEQLNELEQKVATLTRENAVLVSENKRLKQALKKERERADGARAGRLVTPKASLTNDEIPRPAVPLVEQRTVVTPGRGEARVDGEEEQSQTQYLEQIQSERRALEHELERLEQLQTPRREGLDTQNDDDNRCPMCRRVIDDHSDAELDACIEQETAAVLRKHSVAEAPRPHVPPRTPPPVSHKPLTPRATAVKTPASPSLQELSLKLQAPTPPSLEASRQRRSVRDLAHARTANGSSDGPRPSTAGSSNNSPELPIPIVHQGSKSVKALKKFQAASPYHTKSKTNTSTKGSPPRVTGPPPTNNNTPPELSVTGSIRDIGLSLLIYKFRYDCWYPCTVVGVDTKRRLHCCQYEYGDKQWQDLAQNKVKIVGRE